MTKKREGKATKHAHRTTRLSYACQVYSPSPPANTNPRSSSGPLFCIAPPLPHFSGTLFCSKIDQWAPFSDNTCRTKGFYPRGSHARKRLQTPSRLYSDRRLCGLIS